MLFSDSSNYTLVSDWTFEGVASNIQLLMSLRKCRSASAILGVCLSDAQNTIVPLFLQWLKMVITTRTSSFGHDSYNGRLEI